MSFNPYATTAENFAFVLDRHETTIEHAEDDACIGHEIVSVPNGKHYGINGHVPCDHTAVFYYPDAVNKVSQFGIRGWSHHVVG